MRVTTLTLCSKGSTGSGIIFFPEDLRCNANLQSIPEKGYTNRFATFPFVLLKGVNVSARLTRSPGITRCPMWLLTSVRTG